MITLLNTSILTAFGTYNYRELSLQEARRLVADGVHSAIGHQSTADLLSALLDVPVAAQRIEYVQQPGDQALVFKLKNRPPEGTVLSRAQLETYGYTFGLLVRTS